MKNKTVDIKAVRLHLKVFTGWESLCFGPNILLKLCVAIIQIKQFQHICSVQLNKLYVL